MPGVAYLLDIKKESRRRAEQPRGEATDEKQLQPQALCGAEKRLRPAAAYNFRAGSSSRPHEPLGPRRPFIAIPKSKGLFAVNRRYRKTIIAGNWK